MTSYLVDTDVLSAARRQARDRGWRRFVTRTPSEKLFVSVVTIGEIERGARSVRRRDPVFADALDRWLAELVTGFAANILPVSLAVARRWSRLAAEHGRSDTDLLIAATAFELDLTVVTRNTRHFVPLGVPVFDPFAAR